MRVGINATSLNDRPSGARQRFLGLYGALFRAQPENIYIIYEPRDCPVASWFGDCPNVIGVATPLYSTDRWSRLLGGMRYWPKQLATDRLDLFEALHLPLTRAPNCPTLMTVHDIRAGGADSPQPQRMLYRRMLRRALSVAEIITVSDAMRDALMKVLPSARVTTIHNGIDAEQFAASQVDLPGHGARRFLLAVGHFEKRKNYTTLLHAFVRIAELDDTLDLVIIGKDGGDLARIEALVTALGIAPRVSLRHNVDDATLVAYYRGAQLLVFPSTYEGFGIPILEAMAAGTAMALSDLPVFRELTQGHATYFDPGNAAEMAKGIIDLLGSPRRLAEQIEHGRRRLADFAFAKLADQLDALHRGVAAQTSRPPGKSL